MVNPDEHLKSDTAKREEEVIAYWKENNTFEKSLEKKAPHGEFVFYDGPPFATGLPHMGNLLSSIIKDVVPRYKTMRGFRVRRRWGWDCHGLPIESLIEKRLNLKTKKDILDIGIDTFNEAARASVLEFEHEWEKYVDRIGRWVDFKNSYKTMDNSYIESVWWALKKMHEKGLLYEGRKVLMYCPHCETPLAKAEIAMDHTYQDVTEEAVTVRFKVKRPVKYGLPENIAFLAWTTTPWTLPGNVALAVNPDISYVLVPESDGMVIIAKDRLDMLRGGTKPKVIVDMGKEYKGHELVGMEYEPLYDIPALRQHTGKKHRVVPASFVSTDEGTGIVHTAVMYGEDDFTLGQKENVPMVQLLNPNGTYNSEAPLFLRDMYIKDAEALIKDDLQRRGLLFEKKHHTHSYPHCYRCGTPLIYNAVSSWFINIQKVKEKMLSENETIMWVPAHLKHGRFKNIVEAAPDWTISRNRFWASPLPIWKEKGGTNVLVIGSLDELKRRVKKSGNRYFVMRHAEAEQNVRNIVSCDIDDTYSLTEKGREQARAAISELANLKITRVYSSPLRRARETAELIADGLGIARADIRADERLGEFNFGVFNGKPIGEFIAHRSTLRSYDEKFPGGESYLDAKRRFGSFLQDLEREHKGENILVISHGVALESCIAVAEGADLARLKRIVESHSSIYAQTVEIFFTPLPFNTNFELDLHRPYTDSLALLDDAGKEYERISEVVDCWVESGSMPFAQDADTRRASADGRGRESMDEYVKRIRYPGDFIAEYIAQTRTWFYYMHAVGVLLFNKLAFRSVVSTGTILAADGSKMSKSKGNYTDPLAIMDRYGADALRFHLMSSVVMQAEDLNFRDEDVRDAGNRIVGILWNCFKFFELYKAEYDGKTRARESAHVLDRWIVARLNEVVRETTRGMDTYDTPRACRTLRMFIDDYSTWYVRRSRERVKKDNTRDKQFSLATQREALLTLAKLLAPLTPFLAESIYRGIGGPLESVHLEEWPVPHRHGFFERLFDGDADAKRLRQMAKVRSLVSQALEARDKAGIKVRQPLARLVVKSPQWRGSRELTELIEEEVNVKEVLFETGVDEGVVLDTNITPQLREEGVIRDTVRAVQDARKAARLKPGEHGRVSIVVPMESRAIVEKQLQTIGERTNTDVVIS